jgi:hypothetical protein
VSHKPTRQETIKFVGGRSDAGGGVWKIRKRHGMIKLDRLRELESGSGARER